MATLETRTRRRRCKRNRSGVHAGRSGSRGRIRVAPRCVAAGVTVHVKHAVGGAAAVSAVALLWCYRVARAREEDRGGEKAKRVGVVVGDAWPRKLAVHAGEMWYSAGEVLRRNQLVLNALQQGRGGVASTYFKPISGGGGGGAAAAAVSGVVRGSDSEATSCGGEERWDDSGHGVTWLVMEKFELTQIRDGAKAVLRGVWREIAKLWMVVEGAGIVVNLVYSLDFKSGGANWKDEERTQAALNVGMGKSRANLPSLDDQNDTFKVTQRNRRVSLKDAESFASVRTCFTRAFVMEITIMVAVLSRELDHERVCTCCCTNCPSCLRRIYVLMLLFLPLRLFDPTDGVRCDPPRRARFRDWTASSNTSCRRSRCGHPHRHCARHDRLRQQHRLYDALPHRTPYRAHTTVSIHPHQHASLLLARDKFQSHTFTFS